MPAQALHVGWVEVRRTAATDTSAAATADLLLPGRDGMSRRNARLVHPEPVAAAVGLNAG